MTLQELKNLKNDLKNKLEFTNERLKEKIIATKEANISDEIKQYRFSIAQKLELEKEKIINEIEEANEKIINFKAPISSTPKKDPAPKKMEFKKTLNVGGAKLEFTTNEKNLDPKKAFAQMVAIAGEKRKKLNFSAVVNVINENPDTNVTDLEQGYHVNADETVNVVKQITNIITSIVYQNAYNNSVAMFLAGTIQDFKGMNGKIATVLSQDYDDMEFLGEAEPKKTFELGEVVYTQIKAKKIAAILRISQELLLYGDDITQSQINTWVTRVSQYVTKKIDTMLATGNGEKEPLSLISSKRDGVVTHGFAKLPVTPITFNSIDEVATTADRLFTDEQTTEGLKLALKNSVFNNAFIREGTTTGGTDRPIVRGMPGQNMFEIPAQGVCKRNVHAFKPLAAVNAGIIGYASIADGFQMFFQDVDVLFNPYSRAEFNEVEYVKDFYCDWEVADSDKVFVLIDNFSAMKATADATKLTVTTSQGDKKPNEKLIFIGATTSQTLTTDANSQITLADITAAVGTTYKVQNTNGDIIYIKA